MSKKSKTSHNPELPGHLFGSPTAVSPTKDLIEVWEEWIAPFPGANPPWRSEFPGTPSCDRAIHRLTVVPTSEFKNGKRPEDVLEIRVADRRQFLAPIAMLMDAHTCWDQLSESIERLTKEGHDCRSIIQLYDLKLSILIARKDTVDVRLYRNGKRIDRPSGEHESLYTICVKMLQHLDVQ
jgi:hypothetical protein